MTLHSRDIEQETTDKTLEDALAVIRARPNYEFVFDFC